MPQVVITAGARRGLGRCMRFLAQWDREAAAQAAQAIERRLSLLDTNPQIGRPVPTKSDLRELVIGHGRSGYVALYRYEKAADAVLRLGFQTPTRSRLLA